MNPVTRAWLVPLCLLAAAAFSPRSARAASYLPLSDEELAFRAPVIVRARVGASEARIEKSGEGEIVVTRTEFEPLEVFKGAIASPMFSIELPGGEAGGVFYEIPGTPSFRPGGEVILFLSPTSQAESDRFGLTEFALSRFEIVTDAVGRRFAVRPDFSPSDDDHLSRRENVLPARAGARHPRRDADSFEAALRSLGSGEEFLPIRYASPRGEASAAGLLSPLWVNIGGAEGGNRLYRWFWDTGRSSPAQVVAVGTQSGLSDGSDGLASVENAAVRWSAIPGAAVLYSPASGSAQVVVNLDVASHGSYWSEPIPCTSGGVLGVGGPGPSSGAGSFKGDGNYAAVTSGSVWMRKLTGGCYSWRWFRTAVLHEVGHTLGLGHPDQSSSVHSTTSAADRGVAVMRSSIPTALPDTPQADDIAAILWLYGTGVTAPAIPDRPRPILSTRRPPAGSGTAAPGR